MRTKKFAMKCKRVLAVVLAFAMMLTTFVDGTFVSKASTSTLPYTGEIRDNGEALFIEAWAFQEHGMTFDDATIQAVLNSQTQEFRSIYIQYPDKSTTTISMDVWNAAVAKLNDSEDRYVQFAFVDGADSFAMDWFFNKPITTISPVVMKANVAFGSNVTVSFDNTAFPSETAGLNLNTDSQMADYQMFINAFGNSEINLEYVDPSGNVVDTDARYQVDGWVNGDGTQVTSYHLQFGRIHELNAGVTYTLQKEIYKGTVHVEDNGRWTALNIDAMEAGLRNVGFTKQEILDVLAYHAGEEFNHISIIQPYSRNEIYADVVNTATGMLKEDSGKNVDWYFNDWSGVNMQTRWGMEQPQPMSQDVQVSAQLGFNADGTPYVNVGSTAGLNAENLWVGYMVSLNENATLANSLMAALGTQEIRIEAAGSDANGDYSVDEWNVFVRLNHADSLTPGVNYTIKEKAYTGNISYDRWDDGYEYVTLWIDAMDAGKSGSGFTEQELLDILSTYGSGQFDQVRIKQPESQNVIYKSVAEAALPLFKDYDDKSLGWTFADVPGNTDFTWRLDAPYSMSGDQVVSTMIGFDGDGKPFVQMGDSSNISAEQLGLEFGASYDMSSEGPALVNALGRQEMDISAGDTNVEGYYNGTNEWVHFTLWGVERLDPNTSYTIGKRVYKGDVNIQGNGEKHLEINFRNMQSSGMTFDDTTLLSILNQYTDTDFNRVYIYAPAGYTTFSADVWNKAVSLLSDAMMNDQWNTLQLGYEGPYTTQWSFHYPYEDDQPITLDINTTWTTDGKGMIFDLPRTQYPAYNSNVTFNTTSNDASLSTFEDAFGTNNNMKLEIVDDDGNVMEASEGWYECNHWDDGYNRSVNINSLQELAAGKTYSLQQATYRGNEWYDEEEDYRNLNISYWGFDGTGVNCSEEAILDILEQKAATGVKYNTVSMALPEAGEVSAELWNAALALLKNRDEVREYQDANIQINIEPADESTYITYWRFSWPEEMEAGTAVSLKHGMMFTPDSIDVGFETTAFPAEHTSLEFETYSNRTDFTSFIDVFGEREVELELVDGDNKVASRGYCNPFYYNEPEVGFRLNIYDMGGLEAGKTYRIQEYTYRGHIESWEDEDGNVHQNLLIDPWGFGHGPHEPATVDEIISALQLNAGQTFNEIYITQIYNGEGTVPASVINEAVKLFDPESWNHLVFGFHSYDDDNQIWGYQWAFEDIKGMENDLTASVEIGHDGDNVTMMIVGDYDTSGIDAQSINLHYHTERGTELGTMIADTLGEDRGDLMIEGTDKEAYYEPQEEDVWLGFFNVAELESNIEYVLATMSYQGNAYYDGDYSALDIYWDGFAEYGEEFNEEALLALLETRAERGDKFNSVWITLPTKSYMAVSEEVWNAALQLLVPSAWNETDLTLTFDDYETYSERWTFINPQIVSDDVTMKSTVTFGTSGKGISIKWGKTDYSADRVDWGIYSNTYRTDYEKFDTALGAESMRLDIALNGNQTGVTGEYNAWGDGNHAGYDLLIMGVNELAKDKTYKTQKFVYAGDINIWEDEYGNETSYLDIYPHNAGYGDSVIPAEDIIEILSRNKGKTFDQVYIEYPVTENNVIYADVVNAALKYLKKDGEQILKFAFVDYQTGEKNEIWMQYATAMTKDQENVTAHIGVDANGVPYVNKGELSDLSTMNIQVWYETFDADKISAIEEYFVGNRDVSVDGTWAEGWVEFNDEHAVIHLRGIGAALEDNRDYTISPKQYAGEEYVWDDGTKALIIDEYGFRECLSEFTEETLVELLSSKAGEDFGQITIQYPRSFRSTISKEVWNAAVAAMYTFDPEQSDLGMPKLVTYFQDEAGYSDGWTIEAPSFVDEDVALDVAFDLSDKLTIQLANTDFAAELVGLDIQTNNADNMFADILGTGEKRLQLTEEGKLVPEISFVSYRGGESDWYTWGALFIGDVQNLKANAPYVVSEYEYRGDVGLVDGEEIDSLHINAEVLGKTKLTAADLEFITYYEDLGIKFNVIAVEQKYASSNVISKDIINALRPIMAEDGIMRFMFCRCEETEDDYIFNDMVWVLTAPGEAEKDINANISLTTPANQGVKVMFNANTYNAESVRAGFVADQDAQLAQDLMASVEGAGHSREQAEYVDYLLAIKKGTEPDFNKNVEYERYDADDIVALSIYDVQDYEAKVSYTMSQVNYIEPGLEVFEVGVPYDWNERLTNEADGAVTWKSLSANLVDIVKDGTLTAVNPGMFVVTGTYKADGKVNTEVWIAVADIILKDISFSQSEMEVSVEDIYHYLEVQSYPANAVVEASDLVWASSDEDVAVVDSYGGIEVKGVGTTTITATVQGTDISASCEFTVVEEITVPEEALAQLQNIFAVTNIDATLGDVVLPEGFAWKEPATKLSAYVGLSGSEFAVVYTTEDGQEIEMSAWLPFMTIQGINLHAVDFDMSAPYVVKGDSVAFTYEVVIANGSYEQLQQHPKFENLSLVPTGMVADEENEGQFVFVTDEKTSVGKKTVKLALNNGKKAIVSTTATLQVTKELVAGFEDVTFDPAMDENGEVIPNTWQLVFWNPETYAKPTFTSSDTSVLKFGKLVYPTAAEIAAAKENGTELKVLIPYTEGKAGDVLVTITLADAVKSTNKFVHTIVDSEPKIIETAFTINTSYDLKKAPITIQFANHFLPIEDLAIVNDTKGFAFELDTYDPSAKKATGFITLPEDTIVKAGTHTVTLRAVVEQSGFDVKEYNIPIKVKVATTKPSVTFKQTKKINTFFDQTEGDAENFVDGYGMLTMTSKTDIITNVTMEADDFELYEVNGSYVIFYKPDADGKDEKKVTITYDVVHPTYGTITGMEKTMNLSTENKAPALVLSEKSMTLYPGYNYTGFCAWDKNTGRYVDLTNVSVVKSAKEVIQLSTDGWNKTEVKVGKNDYALCTVDGMIWIDLVSRVQAADTLKFRIQQDNWTKPIDVSFKVDVKTAAPKIKLTSSKLTLNINEEVYFNETASAAIQLPGYNQFLENAEVSFTANDAKSKAVLNDEIKLTSDGDSIFARFNFDPSAPASERPKGSYSFKVWISNGHFQTSANFTVSIVNKPASQGIKLTKSGSIDVLNREGTYLTYAPKFTNLTGSIFSVEVIGQDANKFEPRLDMNGKITLHAKEGVELSTAATYKVAFNIGLVNFAEDGSYTYFYESPVQSFKVVQGKPKVTITSNEGTTLYTQAGNALIAEIDAVLKNEAVQIEDVTLANYAGDLDLVYDAEEQTITLSRKKIDTYYTVLKDITKMGKSWNVKLNVKFKDQAGNTKDTQVTYKVTIK